MVKERKGTEITKGASSADKAAAKGKVMFRSFELTFLNDLMDLLHPFIHNGFIHGFTSSPF